MSRKPRVSYPGAFFHVISRAVDGAFLFQDEKEFSLYLNLLANYSDIRNVEIHSYTLLNTHSHMIALTPFDNISSFMKSLDISYALKINNKRERKGHLFGDRFQSIVIDSNRYLIGLSGYIHVNSVEAGIVNMPEDYKWSSFRYFVTDEKPPDFLVQDYILGMFNDDPKEYYDFVIGGMKKGIQLPEISKIGGIECYGSPSFAKKTLRKYERRKEDLKSKRRRWYDKNKPFKYDRIISIVMSNIENPPDFGYIVQSRANRPAFIKGILAFFLAKYSNLSNKDIANLLGYRNQSSVSMQLKKVYKYITGKEVDNKTSELIAKINKEILKF